MQNCLLKTSKTSLVLLMFFVISTVFAQQQAVQTQPEIKPAEFTVITQSINTKLFEGDTKNIKTFLENRKQFINQLTDQLTVQLKSVELEVANLEKQIQIDEAGEEIDNLYNKDTNDALERLNSKKEKIKETINNFKDIHYKHVNLLHELDNTEEDKQNDFVTAKPYGIFSVLKLNDHIQEMLYLKQQLDSQIKQSTERLKKLSSLLNDDVVQYTMLLSKESKSLDLYNAVRNIYLYQADYALLKLKNNKYERTFEFVTSELDNSQKLLPKMIQEMLITDDDVEKLTKTLTQLDDAYTKLKTEHTKLNKGFDKLSFKAELDLDNLEIKIKNVVDDQEIIHLQIQRQLNLHRVKYSYFIKNLLQQKELAVLVKKEIQEFNLDWIQAYEHKKSKPSVFKEFIKSAQEKISSYEDIQVKNQELLDSLNRSRLDIASLQQKYSSDTTDNPNRHQKALLKQLDKNLKTIQRLSLQLDENNISIETSISKNSRIIKVLSQQFNKIELIGQWFGDKFKAQIDKVKNVLYYPITSFDDKPFTLAIVLKVLLYFILGFVFLKLFRPRLTKFLIKRTKLSEGAAFSISTLIYYIGGLLVFLLALSVSGFNLGQMMIVFGALGVGIGFGLQNIANNFISGMILLIDRTLTVGDSVTLNDGTHGKVAKLAMRYTVIRTNGGYDIIVPNSELIANRVTSMTFDDNYLRIEIPFGVSYNSDPEQVREITLEVANKIKHTINRESQTSAVLFSGFGDNSLDFILRVWVFIYDRYRPYAIKSDYYYKLFAAFKEAGIEIPFPQRDLHIKSIVPNTIIPVQDNDEKDNK